MEGETKDGDVKDEDVAALADSLSWNCQERAKCGSEEGSLPRSLSG